MSVSLVSICIPAYKRPDFLKRLLDSISIQSFKNFEVIVTDDSPDDTIKELCIIYQDRFPLYYHRNPETLGTPENWNEGIRKAKGDWIKPMHDDDWFAGENSLQSFANAATTHPQVSFLFSSYCNVYSEDTQLRQRDISPGYLREKLLFKNPNVLFSRNIIGPPSCVIYRMKKDVEFDNRLKWLVDIDFYIRYLCDTRFLHIPEVLVNIGISETQVTKKSFRKSTVEVPEYFLLLAKTGTGVLENLIVFDAWWRLFRNLEIKNVEAIRQTGYAGNIPKRIISIIHFQSKINIKFLNVPVFSKLIMMICYLFSN